MHVRPQIVYKYKSISTQTDFNRVVDIIKSNHIYLPKPSMLNDPMEANALQVYLGCMGAGYTLACGKIHPIVEDRQISTEFSLFLQFQTLLLCGRIMRVAILAVA